jgi:hypothetical protein
MSLAAAPLQRSWTSAVAARPWVATILLTVAAVGLRAWSPTDDQASAVCFVKRCTGVSCPGCGMTRGLAYLVRGDLAAAWRNHPLAVMIAAEITVATALLWLTSRRAVRFDWSRHGTLWLAAHIPLLLGVWVIRAVGGTLPL